MNRRLMKEDNVKKIEYTKKTLPLTIIISIIFIKLNF